MRKGFILILGLVLICFSQNSETEAVKAGINKLFIAMKNSDSTGIKSSFTKQAILQTIMKNGEVKTENIPAFTRTVAKAVKIHWKKESLFRPFISMEILRLYGHRISFIFRVNFHIVV